jgi:single-stranded-DNA-specific exonuclease
LSWTGAKWVKIDPDLREVAALRQAGLGQVSASILAGRRPSLAAGAESWLHPSWDHLHDPYAMHGMAAAVERLRRAAKNREKIRIITDYDVDGTTSSLILQAALRRIGHEALDYHIPDRFEEGYGFSTLAADRAADEGARLIVTADIGVRDHAAVTRARNRGLDVLVCDHHLPAGEAVPDDAVVLCPPQRACSYPNRALAACGVSLKLAQALLEGDPRRDTVLHSLVKLAAVGTVADMVALSTLENRAIVALGLHELNTGPHAPGLDALLQVAGLSPGAVDASDLGFRIGPRINAAGRIAHARLVVKLFTSRDPVEARSLARQLDELNAHRKQIQARLTREALQQVPTPPPAFVVVSGQESEGWHRGVVGIVASRVKDETHRPSAVVSIQGDLAVGSVRSVPSVHAVQALDAVSDLLLKYGGHPAAAGFTVKTADLPTLSARLAAWVSSRVPESSFVLERRIDAEVGPGDLAGPLLHDLQRLGPYGQDHPEPHLLVAGIRPSRATSKADGRLLALDLPGPHGAVEAVWWGRGEWADRARSTRLDLLGTLGTHTWQGETRLQLQVIDARNSES